MSEKIDQADVDALNAYDDKLGQALYRSNDLFDQLRIELKLDKYQIAVVLKAAIKAIKQLKAIKSNLLTFCNIGILSAVDASSISAELKTIVQEANDQFTLEPYNAVLFNDFGSSNVELWHNYIRLILDDAHEWYEAQVQGDQ